MKKRMCAILLSVALVMSLFLSTSASGGSSSDPVVTKSYVDVTFFQSAISNATAKINSWASSLKTKYSERAESYVSESNIRDKVVDLTAEAVLRRLP